jgi:hypothetical protein
MANRARTVSTEAVPSPKKTPARIVAMNRYRVKSHHCTTVDSVPTAIDVCGIPA